MSNHPLAGVYTAAVTPLRSDFTPALDDIPPLLDFLARRGCHGALLLGTTGEGPSFSPEEREAILKVGVKVRETYPDFRLFAGTGTPSLDETVRLNKTAFDLGFNGVVVLPPFYFRDASEEGLFAWFSEVIHASVPEDGFLLGYHFPKISGVALPLSLLTQLRENFPDQFAGLKDSSGDLDHATTLTKELDENLASPKLREIWDAHQSGEKAEDAQGEVNQARDILDPYTPFPASVKGLLAQLHDFPHWPVKPPLVSFSEDEMEQAAEKIKSVLPNK
jgi:dihydrodipicolinate synthase/N-acetylneuraminate lyase